MPTEKSPPSSSSSGRRLGRIIAINLLVSIGLLILVELGARIAGFGDRPHYVPSGDLMWTLVPNQVTRNHVTCRRITIDGKGMRIVPGGDDDPGRLQVLALGNSVTFGYGVSDSESYESVMQRELDARDPGRWRILNGGVMGYTMYFERLRLKELMGRGVKPDLILLANCFNDRATWPGEHYSAEDRARIEQSVRFKNIVRSSALYNLVVERLSPGWLYLLRNKFLPFGFGTGPKNSGPPAATTGSPDSSAPPDTSWRTDWIRYYRRQVDTTIETVRKLHIPVIAIMWPDPLHRGMSLRDPFKEECASRGVPVVDLQSIVEGRKPQLPFFDPVHPDAPAVQVLVDQAIMPFFLTETARMDSAIVAAHASAGPGV